MNNPNGMKSKAAAVQLTSRGRRGIRVGRIDDDVVVE